MPVKPVPDGYHTVTPYLVVPDVAALLPFLQKAFGAEIKEDVKGPEGKSMHAEVRIGSSMVMLGQANEQHAPMPCCLYLYVEDVDALYARAVKAGAESLMEPTDQFYGDRNGGVKDPAGNCWWIGTHKEDLSAEEIAKRAMAQAGSAH
jgi:PhnB protein